jgi:hypothetical protein
MWDTKLDPPPFQHRHHAAFMVAALEQALAG